MATKETKEAGQVREQLSVPIDQISGHVTVDLLDDRGKTVERVEGTNYVNQSLWERWAKYSQRTHFLVQNQATILTRDTTFNRDPRIAPALFDETLVCWNDTTAENTADKFCFGEPIAWAHKYGQGTLMTRQGLSNPLLHEISENALKWGFEWPTTNGNGTFQSVGWRRIGWRAASGDPILYDMPNISRRYLSGYAQLNFTGFQQSVGTFNAVSLRNSAAYYNSADSSLYLTGTGTSGANMRCQRYPLTFTNNSYTMGTPVDMTADPIFAAGAIVADGSTAQTTRQTLGITRLGASGDWIGVGTTGATTARRPWIRRVTTGGSVTYTNVNVGTFAAESYLHDVTYDGVNLYAVGGLVNTNRMYVIDPATGNVTSTVTLSGFPTLYQTLMASATTVNYVGIEWDATNSWFWIEVDFNGMAYTFNVNASGVWQGVMLCQFHPSTITTAAPTIATGSILYGLGTTFGVSNDVDQFSLQLGQIAWVSNQIHTLTAALDTDAVPPISSVAGWRLITMNGQTWRCVANSNAITPGTASYGAFGSFTDNYNFFSRSLLGAPVVKTTANAMRITYEMTFS